MKNNTAAQAMEAKAVEGQAVERKGNTVAGIETGYLESRIVTRPRDERLLQQFDDLQAHLSVLTSPAGDKLDLTEKNEAARAARRLIEDIFACSTSAMQDLYHLEAERDWLRAELDQHVEYVKQLRTRNPLVFFLQRLEGELRKAAKHLIGRIKNVGTQNTPQSSVAPAPDLQPAENPFADVDNSNSAFEIFKNWVTIFHLENKRCGAARPLVTDRLETIYELNEHFPLADKTILELGPLEGGNTKQMLDLGARSITGIESNRESFLKCLIAKNEIPLRDTELLFGDLNRILREDSFQQRPTYDLCLASGLLYHMQYPLSTIDLLASTAASIYVWSHVASDRAPAGDWVSITDDTGRTYRGRRNSYRASDVLGGVGGYAVWLTKEDMHRAFRDRGYQIQELGEVHNFKGDAVKFIARRA